MAGENTWEAESVMYISSILLVYKTEPTGLPETSLGRPVGLTPASRKADLRDQYKQILPGDSSPIRRGPSRGPNRTVCST